jgi:hypothetical protein
LHHQIDVADKLHLYPPTVAGLQCHVFVADIPLLLQLRELGLVGEDVLEEAQLPDLLAEECLAREAQQLDQERIHIDDHSRFGIEDQDGVLGRLEEPAVADLRRAQRLLGPFPFGDVQIRAEYAADRPVRTAQRHLARQKRDRIPFGRCLGFFDEKPGKPTLHDPAVVGAIQLGLVTPRHLVVVFPDDVFRNREARIARERRVAAQEKEVLVLSRPLR